MVSIKILRILADIIFLPVLLVFALFLLGKISFELMAPILVMITAIEMTIFIIFTKKASKNDIMYRVPTNKVIVPKAKLIDGFVCANNEIFSQNIKPINPSHNSIFRISVEFVDKIQDLKFYIIRKCQLNTREQEIDIKDLKDVKHIIDLIIDSKEIVNFKFNKDIALKSFSVDELYIP